MDGTQRRRPSCHFIVTVICDKIASLIAILIVMTLVASSGCSSWQRRKHVDLGVIYNAEAQLPDNYRNPVIVVPGILGSRLVDSDSGRVVWGELGRKSLSPRKAESLRALALPMAQDVPLEQLRDSVREDGPLDELTVKLLGIPIKIDAYAQILASLGVAGYRDEHFRGHSRENEVNYGDEHFTCFQFSYDWRRDVSETAAELDEFINQKEQYIRQQYREKFGIENANIKFDIVAHSMGGLVTRYYLRYGNQPLPADGSLPDLNWAGANHVGRAILVGTPNAGAPKAIVELIEGKKLARPFAKFPESVIGTMPSTYQLLPRNRHLPLVSNAGVSIDLFDPSVWQKFGWGLANPKQAQTLKKLLPEVPDADSRRRIALEHQKKCLLRAKQFHESLDLPSAPPPGLELRLFAGDAKFTLHQIVIDGETGQFLDEVKTAGDGVVTRSSAILQEAGGVRPYDGIPWANKTFISAGHLGLTKDRTFVDNVLSLLLEQGEQNNRDFEN